MASPDKGFGAMVFDKLLRANITSDEAPGLVNLTRRRGRRLVQSRRQRSWTKQDWRKTAVHVAAGGRETVVQISAASLVAGFVSQCAPVAPCKQELDMWIKTAARCIKPKGLCCGRLHRH